MKTFYTVRDIEDMHAAGVAEIHTHDDVVLTDVAREKAIALGMRLVPLAAGGSRPRGGSASAQTGTTPVPPSPAATPQRRPGDASDDLVRKVKAAVVARLGTDQYNDVLDRIIPQVMAQLKK